MCLNIDLIINIWKKYFIPENGNAFCSKGSKSKFSFHRAYPLGLCHSRKKTFQEISGCPGIFPLCSETI